MSYSDGNEYTVEEINVGDRTVIVTNMRIIVTDTRGKGNPTFDVHRADLAGFDTDTRRDGKYLYHTGTSLAGTFLAGISWFILMTSSPETVLRSAMEGLVLLPFVSWDMLGTFLTVLEVTETGLFAMFAFGSLVALTLLHRYVERTTPLLVIKRKNRSPFQIAGKNSREVETAERELKEKV